MRPAAGPATSPLAHGVSFAGVSHFFAERQVLGGVTLSLTERRIGIVGANGSGKSTLVRMINGLVRPTSGTVTVGGLDVAKHGRDVRRRVGFVFTDPDHQIVMPTVAEDVAFSLRRSGFGRAEVDERVTAMLDRVGLSGHRDHPAHLLSGGQKQLLALAAMLIREPEILVADEPTTLLDLRNTRQLAVLLGELDQQVIVVSHNLDFLADFDRVIVIDDGRVVCDGMPGEALAFYREMAA